MRREILHRAIQGLITLLALSMIIFCLSRLAGDPLDLLLPLDASEENFAAARQQLGLDKPLPVQYGIFIIHAIKGDFGNSLRTGIAARELVIERLPNSISLAAVAVGMAVLLGFPLGILAASRRGTWIDSFVTAVAVTGMAMPSFWIAILLIQVFSVGLKVLPTGGMGGPSYYIMPAFSLALIILAGLTRLIRSGMIDALEAEYIKLARIKGASERTIVWSHALRNALIAPLTFGGMYFAILITMAVIVETVFAWPGLGRLAYEAVLSRDYPVIQAVVMTGGVIVILMNLMVDIVHSYIDPRIKSR